MSTQNSTLMNSGGERLRLNMWVSSRVVTGMKVISPQK
jgi:hypothetical protein